MSYKGCLQKVLQKGKKTALVASFKKKKKIWEIHRISEWLTWPAVADVAINKILANCSVVAGSWATFVNIHFTEIPRETWWTAKKTSYFKTCEAVSQCCHFLLVGLTRCILELLLLLLIKLFQNFTVLNRKIQLCAFQWNRNKPNYYCTHHSNNQSPI